LLKKTPLFLWISSILITGFLSTSVLSYLVSARAIRQSITDQALPLTGDNVYSEIQKDIVRPIFISSQMANNTFLRDWLIAGEGDMSQVVRYLKEVKKEHGTITSFVISEKTRKYYYADGLLQTISQEDPDDNWFFRVRSMKERFETNVDPDLANRNTMTIFINYRVLDYQGKFIGVTGVGLTLNNMKEIVQNHEKRFQRRIYFVNKTGDIVLTSSSVPSSPLSIQQMPGIQKIAPQILKGSTQPLSLDYKLPDGGIGSSTIQLNSRYIPELGWYLLVEQDESTAIKPLQTMLLINLAVSAIAIILILLLILPTVHIYQRRLEKIATTDTLTGLINRQAFDILFSEYLNYAIRSNATLSAVMFDIDHFKQINDRYGHLTGDRVIKQVAEIARNSVRRHDFIARWGGEEFMVLLKDCEIAQAEIVAEKIRSAIANHDFKLDEDRSVVTISAGVANYTAEETAESFFTRIDKALYRAKQSGRDRIELGLTVPSPEVSKL
jgi:diguanylate cyclase (GGDEF)-like protein